MCTDFLKWRFGRYGFAEGQFDCVLMNSPFSGRRERWLKLNTSDLRHIGIKRPLMAPEEVGFLLRAIRLLRDNGVLIAIVPGSVVAAQSTSWLREALFACGHIQVVHQLPRHIFPGTETECYILVFKKSQGHKIRLLNHDLRNPEELCVSEDDLESEKRLDFGKISSSILLKHLVQTTGSLGWKRVGEIASVMRGNAHTPFRGKRGIHTTNFENGAWRRIQNEVYLQSRNDSDSLAHGDLLIKRVGRSSAASLGPCVGVAGLQFSDCVFRLRPNDRSTRGTLLLGFRSIIGANGGKSLLERGTGVPYIVEQDIINLVVPMNLKAVFPRRIREYDDALRRRDYRLMASIEQRTFRQLELLSKNAKRS